LLISKLKKLEKEILGSQLIYILKLSAKATTSSSKTNFLPLNFNYLIVTSKKTKSSKRMEKEIICTQGPMPSTTEDFWRMVWQEKCVAIIMLCRVIENGKKKCEQYWPLEADEWVIKFVVLGIYENSKVLKVKHVLWSAWPDKGVPTSTTSALKLIFRTQTYSPCVIHCSAGSFHYF
uniref:Tyrosine-protein phosphatase domain-containing protein n=1 Tax=Dracunculus medinensis TaxID=318479 RepID=A0A0N4UFZ5_DRAME